MTQAIFKSPVIESTKVRLRTGPGRRATTKHDGAALAGGAVRHESQLNPVSDAPTPDVEHSSERVARERQEAVERGFKEGFESGHREGHAAGIEALAQQVERLEALLSSISAEREQWLSRCESQAFDIAFDAVCRIVGSHAIEPEVVAAIVRQVVGHLRDVDVLQIRLHPADLSILHSALNQDELAGKVGHLADRFVADEEIHSGGCVIDTPRGEYRATLDTQLSRLRLTLKELRQQAIGVEHGSDRIRA